MSLGSIIAFTPAVGYSWPALLPLALLAAAKLGYEAVEDPRKFGLPVLDRVKKKLMDSQIVSLDLKRELSESDQPMNIELLETELSSDQLMSWKKGELTLVFRKDTRGQLFVDVMGPASVSKKKLREEGLEFAREMVRNFAVNRVVTELEKTNAHVVEEGVAENGDIVLKLRRWV